MITKAAPAKVNLYLRVLRKREDGYHDILFPDAEGSASATT